MNHTRQSTKRGGFSLLELLVAIGIIAFLVSISAVMYANFVDRARETATAATIQKIHEQLNQRIEAFNRAMVKENLSRAITLKQGEVVGMSDKAAEILVRKDRFRDAFPQRLRELYGPDGGPGAAGTDDDSANGADDFGEIGYPNTDDTPFAATVRQFLTAPASHNPATESAELLYLMITQTSVFGIPPVDDSEFSTREVRDTDNDGLMEFVDAWGRPLRFYRWPTRLIRPDDTDGDGILDVNRPVADLLIKGLPAAPASGSAERDQLEIDPDDPIGLLVGERTRLASPDFDNLTSESSYHTLDTHHAPLIVSAGPDGELGLYEPFEIDSANDVFGTLAQPGDSLGTVNPSDDLRLPANQTEIIDRLTDNITNRNQRAGGN